MSSKTRRRFTTEQKAQIVRRHLADKVAVSDLADESGVQPSQIHAWVKQVLDQAEKVFERFGKFSRYCIRRQTRSPRRSTQVSINTLSTTELQMFVWVK